MFTKPTSNRFPLSCRIHEIFTNKTKTFYFASMEIEHLISTSLFELLFLQFEKYQYWFNGNAEILLGTNETKYFLEIESEERDCVRK